MNILILLCAALVSGGLVFAQEQFDLSRQAKNPDFSAMPVTKPVTVGTVLPSTCVVGQMFFNSSSAAGANLYGCTAPNTWTALSGGTGSGTAHPTAVVNPTALTFATQNPGVASAPQAIALQDTGVSYMTIYSITVTGADAADFVQTNTCGSQVGSGNSCTITVVFTPNSANSGGNINWTETATLSIAGNQPGTPTTIALTGTGQLVNGGLVVTPSATVATEGQTITFAANRAVTFTKSAGAVGTLTTVDSTHATYVAPSSIPVTSPLAGCPMFPNDSILNTPITNLPANASSTAWLSAVKNYPVTVQPGWYYNAVPGTPSYWTENFYYGAASGSFPLLSWPNKKRENGYDASSGNEADHHQLSILVAPGANQCTTYETYNDAVNPSYSYTCQSGASGCNSTSGDIFTPYSYSLVSGTDAAGLPQYLTLHGDEIKNNKIHHPVRMTLSRGFIQSSSSPALWPANVGNNNGYGTTANALPYGAILRLHSSYSVSGKSTYAQNILNAFMTQGIIVADVGTTGSIIVGSDVWEDPAVEAAIAEALTGLTLNNFDVVDQSSLMVSRNSYQVLPGNSYVTPTSSATVTATDAAPVQGNTYSASYPLALQGVAIGLANNQVSMLPGSYTYNFGATGKAWVTGSSNQSITWTLVSGSGSVTSGGVYTPPSTVSTVTPVVLQATAAADTSATANLYIILYPWPSDGKFRLSLSETLSDSNSYVWQGRAGLETGILESFTSDYPGWPSLSSNAESAVYQAYSYNYGDDVLERFILPNGNYKIRYLLGFSYNGSCNTGTNCGAQANPGLLQIGAQSQIVAHAWSEGQSVAYAKGVPFDYYLPAQVTTNDLFVSMGPNNPDGLANSPFVNLSALEIIPDTTAAHVSIDTGLEAWNPAGTSITIPLVVPHGTTAQLYAVGWYEANTVTWSVSGGGSISSTGLYTAPTSGTATVTVTATSTVNGATATAAISVT